MTCAEGIWFRDCVLHFRAHPAEKLLRNIGSDEDRSEWMRSLPNLFHDESDGLFKAGMIGDFLKIIRENAGGTVCV